MSSNENTSRTSSHSNCPVLKVPTQAPATQDDAQAGSPASAVVTGSNNGAAARKHSPYTVTKVTPHQKYLWVLFLGDVACPTDRRPIGKRREIGPRAMRQMRRLRTPAAIDCIRLIPRRYEIQIVKLRDICSDGPRRSRARGAAVAKSVSQDYLHHWEFLVLVMVMKERLPRADGRVGIELIAELGQPPEAGYSAPTAALELTVNGGWGRGKWKSAVKLAESRRELMQSRLS
ncbi:hypothetical protein M407DRAFT_9231 [Tulasnella calospora MUT 4182]|uniref:Uncharacterized protein n=1 Tax=Tulasnella calospora MUT 4182 TaxID=1051891 RepID=A0A0C3QF90_9AGAM|nr:hypothetical protein M407DRAFT_9231 [Tulasnella calospora MUT 4182]